MYAKYGCMECLHSKVALLSCMCDGKGWWLLASRRVIVCVCLEWIGPIWSYVNTKAFTETTV